MICASLESIRTSACSVTPGREHANDPVATRLALKEQKVRQADLADQIGFITNDHKRGLQAS